MGLLCQHSSVRVEHPLGQWYGGGGSGGRWSGACRREGVLDVGFPRVHFPGLSVLAGGHGCSVVPMRWRSLTLRSVRFLQQWGNVSGKWIPALLSVKVADYSFLARGMK